MKLAPLLVLLLSSLALGDELILKDGKKIEWKTLSDEGETYEVTTPQGTKITVKKDDVDRLAKSRLPELLTGAQFTFDKKRKLTTLDVLSRIDLKKDELVPTWKMAGNAMLGSGIVNRHAKLQTSAVLPEEYDLTMVVESREGDAGINLVLVGGGKPFVFGFSGTGIGLQNVDPAPIPGKFLVKGSPRTLLFMVRREAFIVQMDGKDIYAWKADWNKPSVPPVFGFPAKNVLCLAADAGTLAITRLTLSSPKEQ